jgi:anti-sigma B factor antagonist
MSELLLDQKPIATFAPQGYVSAANAGEFQQNLVRAIESTNDPLFLVDMEKVEFLDSAGLMVLVNGFRLSQNLGRRFSLCSLAPSVKIIFEVTQLDKVFEIFENREVLQSQVG